MQRLDEAAVSRMHGDSQASQRLTREAYELEREAALRYLDRPEMEPTRAILFKGAAVIAMQCGLLREAEKLIATALSGDPPDYLAADLRDLLARVGSVRTRESRTTTLQQGAGESAGSAHRASADRVAIEGILRSASLRARRTGHLTVVGNNGDVYFLSVPPERMAGIVHEYWDSAVRAVGRRKEKPILLDEIHPVSTDI